MGDSSPRNTRYRYSPLNKSVKQIRLIVLKPGPPTSPIQASFQIVSLDTLQRLRQLLGNSLWAALSYVWGPSDQNRVIQISGKNLTVTKNLHEALLYLRGSTYFRLLWVDQICINQRDTDERSSQVAMMHEIFSLAPVVEAWLGTAPSKMVEVFEKIVDAESVLRSFVRGMSPEDLVNLTTTSEFWTRCAGQVTKLLMAAGGTEKECHVSLVECVSIVLDNTWFRRVWTLQEAVLADRLVLLAGKGRMLWQTFDILVRALIPSEHGAYQGTASFWWSVQQLKDLKQERYEADDFRMHTLETLGRKATDDRDYVFGVLGLCGPKFRQHLQPDYNLSTAEVFIRGTLAFFELDKDLAVLESCCAKCRRETGEIPSWCRDWSWDGPQCGHRADTGLDFSTMCPVGRQQLVFNYRPGERVLEVRGLLIDEVDQLLPRPWETKDRAFNQTLIELITRFLSLGGNDKASQSQWLLRTVAALSGTTTDSPEMLPVIKMIQDILLRSDAIKTRDIQSLSKLAEGCDDFLDERWNCLDEGSRCLIMTKDEHIGRACGHAQPGDKVCLLFGGRFPFLLREVAKTTFPAHLDHTGKEIRYQIIGGASDIAGLGGNAGFAAAEEQGIQPQTFRIV